MSNSRPRKPSRRIIGEPSGPTLNKTSTFMHRCLQLLPRHGFGRRNALPTLVTADAVPTDSTWTGTTLLLAGPHYREVSANGEEVTPS